MNDFTKEELKILFLELNIMIRHWGESKEYKDYPKLKDKIQFLIDNYCEHSQHIYYGDIPVGECTECHMVMIP